MKTSSTMMTCFAALWAFTGCTLSWFQSPNQAKAPVAEKAMGVTGESSKKTLGSLVFLGDSLTAGLGLAQSEAFPAIVEEKIKESNLSWRVVNAGVSGDTSAGGLRRLDWVYKNPVHVLFVCLGANDGLRGLAIEETEKNLRGIIERGKKEGSRVVMAGMQLPENYGPRYRTEFAQMYEKLIREFELSAVPFLLEGVALQPHLNQADGIHPNAEGAKIIAKTVWTTLAPILKDYPLERM